jgi:hypothetical protein
LHCGISQRKKKRNRVFRGRNPVFAVKAPGTKRCFPTGPPPQRHKRTDDASCIRRLISKSMI